MAADLQRTKLSEYLEQHVRSKMDEHLESVYTPELADYFLGSDYEDYQTYALQHLEAAVWARATICATSMILPSTGAGVSIMGS